MSEWKEFNLSDLIQTNLNSIGKNYEYDKIVYLDTGSITCNKIETLQEFSIKDAPSRAKRLVENCDIIYSTVRPNQLHYGIIKSPPKNLVVSTGFVVIRSKKDFLNSQFLYHYLTQRTITDYLHSIAEASTSTYPSLKPSDIEKLDIILPPLSEQESIAEVLSSLDDKIDLLHSNNKTLEQLAETLFRQWFVEEADDSWEESELRNLAEVMRGLSYKGSGLTVKSDPNAVPMINLNSVFEGGGFKEAGTKYYNGDYRDQHHIYPGDLIITNTEQGHEHRLIGFTTIIPKSIGQKGIFSQHIYRIVPNDKRISSLYLNQLFKTPNLRDQIIGGTNGSTVNMLPAESVLRCNILIPPTKKLEKYNILANEIQTKQELNYLQIKQLESLRDTLLPKLMSGQVHVNL